MLSNGNATVEGSKVEYGAKANVGIWDPVAFIEKYDIDSFRETDAEGNEVGNALDKARRAIGLSILDGQLSTDISRPNVTSKQLEERDPQLVSWLECQLNHSGLSSGLYFDSLQFTDVAPPSALARDRASVARSALASDGVRARMERMFEEGGEIEAYLALIKARFPNATDQECMAFVKDYFVPVNASVTGGGEMNYGP